MSKQSKLVKQLINKQKKQSLLDKTNKLSNNEISRVVFVSGKWFTRSKEWKELRKAAIEKYGVKCRNCGKIPKIVNIDHILPRKYFPHLALDINNLQPLCSPCNKAKGNKY